MVVGLVVVSVAVVAWCCSLDASAGRVLKTMVKQVVGIAAVVVVCFEETADSSDRSVVVLGAVVVGCSGIDQMVHMADVVDWTSGLGTSVDFE